MLMTLIILHFIFLIGTLFYFNVWQLYIKTYDGTTSLQVKDLLLLCISLSGLITVYISLIITFIVDRI
jgi:hypothetical protein